MIRKDNFVQQKASRNTSHDCASPLHKALKWLCNTLWVRSKSSQWSYMNRHLWPLWSHSCGSPSQLPCSTHSGLLAASQTPWLVSTCVRALVMASPSVQNLLQNFNMVPSFFFCKHLLEDSNNARGEHPI